MTQMTKMKLITNYAVAYLAWILVFILWLAFMFISRDSITRLLTVYYLDGSFTRMKVYQFFNQGYFYILGLIGLVLTIIVENDFRVAVQKGTLYQRITRLIGPQLLLLALAGIGLAIARPSTVVDWIVLAVEIMLGVGLIWLSNKLKPPIAAKQVRKANS